MRIAGASLLALVTSSPAMARSIPDPICTDRPGKGSATCTVPKGHWQVETGLADWTRVKAGGERSAELDLGASAIKYGLTDRLHVEVDVIPYVRLSSRSAEGRSHATGIGDTLVAVKQELGGDGPLTAALYPFVKLPTASKRIGNGKAEGGVRLPLGLTLGDDSRFSLGATSEADLNADSDGHGRHAALSQTIGLTWSAAKKLSLSAELWGQWDYDPAGTTRHYSLDGSAAYRVSDNLQLDAGVNLGLKRSTPGIELYAGLSKLF